MRALEHSELFLGGLWGIEPQNRYRTYRRKLSVLAFNDLPWVHSRNLPAESTVLRHQNILQHETPGFRDRFGGQAKKKGF